MNLAGGSRRPSLTAFVVILGSRFVIDRWRAVRFVTFAGNWLAPLRCWSGGAGSVLST